MVPLRPKATFVLATLCVASSACATKSITFGANEKATVSLVPIGAAGGDGEALGETPVTIELPKLEGKMVKIWGKDLVPQYWVLRDVIGAETKVTLKMERLEKPEAEKPQTGDNLKFRLLMKAYAALAGGQWATARGIAEELGKLDPKIAAPHLLRGIAFMQEGNNAEARTSLETARTLDPEDAEIDKLIKVVQ